MNEEIRKDLIKLQSYQDNWDCRGASKPSLVSIEKAKIVIDWAILNNIDIGEVDADVLGGVAIYLINKNNSECFVWISCRNNGEQSVILINGKETEGLSWGDIDREWLKKYLADFGPEERMCPGKYEEK